MAMSFTDIWEQLKRKDETIDDQDSTVSMSAPAFKKLLRQVYDQGAAAKAAATPPPQAGKSGGAFSEFMDMFGGRFGG